MGLQTTNRAFSKGESTNPDYPSGGAWARLDAALDQVDTTFGFEVDTASKAIAIKEGVVLLNAGSALAMTLAAPVTGSPSAGGDNGKKLKIIAITAQAHTVTTPANVINAADDTVTFAAVGDWVELVAYNAKWYATVGGATPAVLSEV